MMNPVLSVSGHVIGENQKITLLIDGVRVHIADYITLTNRNYPK